MSMRQTSEASRSRWIWPFEILERLGEGGMGVVYRARYVVNGRQVALKMLPEDVADKTALARFEREVEVLKTLRHPNIVRCFGGICEDKRRFYAMELLDGGSLEDKLQERGRFSWEQAVQYGLQMCAALECSHEKGIVHRDVKPSNFLMTPSGQIKLSDFGLASVVSSRKITAAGKTAGTFLYMAPEQIRGQEVTPRTDLYALGCVLYELVTGEVPFLGDTAGATLHLHCFSAAVRPSEKALDLPIAFERIIMQLLEKEPDQRPASASEVSKALLQIGQSVSVVALRSELTQQGWMGTQQRQPEQTHKQKKTSLLPTQTLPVWAITALAVALMVSLMGNLLQFRSARSASRWEQLWIEAAEHTDPDIRQVAVSNLSQMAAEQPASANALKERLKDSNDAVRLAAVQGLGIAAENGRPAVPELMALQKGEAQGQIREAAKVSLAQIRQSRAGGFPWVKWLVLPFLLAAGAAGLYRWLRTIERESRAEGVSLRP